MLEICETFSWKQDYDQLSEHKDLGKPLVRIMHVQTEFCRIAFQPSPPSSKRTLCGRYFSPKIGKFFKTAILTLGMDILTITVVKYDS